MKSGWETKKLGEVCKFIDYRGKTPKKTESGLRLITAKNVKMGFVQDEPLEYVHPEIYDKWMTRGIPQYGDILFTTEAPLGNVAQLDIDDKAVFAQRIIILQPVNGLIDRTFLKYSLISPSKQSDIQNNGTGATVKGIKASLLKAVKVSFPPVPEQRRIVAILDEAFAGIAAAKEKAEQNLKNAKEMFSSSKRRIFSIVEEEYKCNELGRIAEFRNGINFTRNSEGEIVKIIGVKDFKNNFFVPDENIDYVVINGTISEIDLLKNNDILTVRSNGNQELIGRCMIACNVNEKTTHSGFTIRIRSKKDSINPIYLCTYLKSDTIRKQLIGEGTGVNIKSLNQKSLSSLSVPIPNLLKQRQIVSQLDSLSAEISRLESIYQQKLSNLEELKKSLLQQAFSGAL